ncbi:MAG: CatB-related O-acetyltransferase [Acidimicrobiales bacterium]
MRAWLRQLKRFLLRLWSPFSQPEAAVWRKLQRAGRITVGRGTYGIPIVKHYTHDETKLTVGNYSALAENAIVMLGGQHAMDQVTTYPLRIGFHMPGAGRDGMPTHTSDTVIGNDVWLAQRSFVRSGLTIGDGAVIAAGSVLTKDVPPYAVMGGNPAKILRFRHTEEQRAALLEIQWWHWPEDEIRRAVPLLAQTDIDSFIDYARRRFPDGYQAAPADVPAPPDRDWS